MAQIVSTIKTYKSLKSDVEYEDDGRSTTCCPLTLHRLISYLQHLPMWVYVFVFISMLTLFVLLMLFVFPILVLRNWGWTRQVADLLVINGTIYTSDSSLPFADSMAVRNGRILRIGDYSSVQVSGFLWIDCILLCFFFII